MKTRSFTKFLVVVGIMTMILGYSIKASALPETFDFIQHSGFNVITMTSTAGGNDNLGWYNDGSIPAPPANPAGTYYNTVAWGYPTTLPGGDGLLGYDPWGMVHGGLATNLSALKVLGEAGSVSTGAAVGVWGDYVPISTIYHQNYVIQSVNLVTVDVYSEFSFWKGATEIPEPGNAVPVTLFVETPNQSPCSNPLGSNMSVCDDYFEFSLGGFAPVSFWYAGNKYEADFALGNFVSSQTDFPNCPGGVCTVVTAENTTSSMQVFARIRAVPEPASLLLLGLGLLGLGFIKRRK